MLIDTKGDFTMFGDYTIKEGFYNFTLLNAVNKEFAHQARRHGHLVGRPVRRPARH
jgi:hypothetical protein